MSGGERATTLSESLGKVRLRLTAWYVATLFAVLALLGVGLFATVTARFDREVDALLAASTRELVRLARVRDSLGHAALLHPESDFRVPDRRLFLVDTLGHSIAGADPEPWVQALARRAWQSQLNTRTLMSENERIQRAHADVFTLASGRALVAVAVADEVELEDRYASLIALFSVAALIGLVLVAVGGWFLARKSTTPVEEAFAHMRRFMADAAHELRTPLTVVRSRAEVALQRPREDADYVRVLRGIEQDATRLGSIVEDLLMLARADTGERPIDRKRVFLDDIALDAGDAARAIADRKSVRLEVGDFEEAPVQGDAALLRQLVMIVLDNAIKFTPAHGVVRLAISVPTGGPDATLTVSDTGVGIPADQIPHVFERFYRGDPARTRASDGGAFTSQGTGLGLSIARWIAGEHGATITLESVVGEGTTVVVRFPIAAADVLSSS